MPREALPLPSAVRRGREGLRIVRKDITMAEFQRLPSTIQRAVYERLSPDEEVRFCFVAGSLMFSSGDYVVLTDRRILMLDERHLGHLNVSYVNVQWDVPFCQILSVDRERTLWHRLFYQMDLKIQVDDRIYIVHNVSYREGMRAYRMIQEAQGKPHG